MTYSCEDRRIIDLVAVEVENRKDCTIMYRIKEFV